MTFKLFKVLQGIIQVLRVLDIVWCTNNINLLAVDVNL
jgi:hypothetical protein